MHLHDGAGHCEECEPEQYATSMGDGGISQAQASRIADEILENDRRHGTASPTSQPDGPRRNRHLDGYGDPRKL